MAVKTYAWRNIILLYSFAVALTFILWTWQSIGKKALSDKKKRKKIKKGIGLTNIRKESIVLYKNKELYKM